MLFVGGQSSLHYITHFNAQFVRHLFDMSHPSETARHYRYMCSVGTCLSLFPSLSSPSLSSLSLPCSPMHSQLKESGGRHVEELDALVKRLEEERSVLKQENASLVSG